MEAIKSFIEDYLVWLSLPRINIIDILEIVIIAFIIYQLITWIKDTRAWVVMKGILVVFAFYLIALLLNMNVILWIFSNSLSVVIMAVIIVFQPELRKALEQLGRKNFFRSIISMDDSSSDSNTFNEKSVTEIVRATFEMAKYKTGVLIVIEQEDSLAEYERTGIMLDASISSQLLINIFEKNTPLHDGAVIIRNNRITSATCYLPLSDNSNLSKELGTRHRAGIGVSEVTDSFTIIVSEETGKVSIATKGRLIRDVDDEGLRKRLESLFMMEETHKKRKIKLWKGRQKNEKNAVK